MARVGSSSNASADAGCICGRPHLQPISRTGAAHEHIDACNDDPHVDVSIFAQRLDAVRGTCLRIVDLPGGAIASRRVGRPLAFCTRIAIMLPSAQADTHSGGSVRNAVISPRRPTGESRSGPTPAYSKRHLRGLNSLASSRIRAAVAKQPRLQTQSPRHAAQALPV